MVLYMYVGSLLPYIEGLDSWLFERILDDPFGEVMVIEILNSSRRKLSFFLCCAKDCYGNSSCYIV